MWMSLTTHLEDLDVGVICGVGETLVSGQVDPYNAVLLKLLGQRQDLIWPLYTSNISSLIL